MDTTDLQRKARETEVWMAMAISHANHDDDEASKIRSASTPAVQQKCSNAINYLNPLVDERSVAIRLQVQLRRVDEPPDFQASTFSCAFQLCTVKRFCTALALK